MLSRIFAHRLIVVSGLVITFLAVAAAATVGLAPPSAAHPGYGDAAPSPSGLSGPPVVVVHPANALDCLSTEQLHRLWRDGSATGRWNDLDSDLTDDPITLHAPAPGTAVHKAFAAAVVGEEGVIRTDTAISQGEDQTIDRVASDEHAIGVVTYELFVAMQRPLKSIAVDAGDGCVEPSPTTFHGGTYVPAMSPGNADRT